MSESSKNPERNKKNWLEWSVFGVSCLLVLATTGFLAKEAWFQEEGPPKIEVTLGEVIRNSDGVDVPVTVTNHGNEVASDLQIEVQAQSEGESKTATFTIPYLPKRATRQGSVSFKETEPVLHLSSRVAGYSRP